MDQKQQIVDSLKKANNVLVTVSNNPSVDQLAACLGLTLALNKIGKHAAAVFSGAVPSTIEFLEPEKTIEPNTDSLRDFIISLDKSKADKLRYKVEDQVVRIFITPYHTSISEKDLEFSQGDFNVDLIVALGVHEQTELDQAITAHGRILHDAAVATVNVKPGGELGSINWLVPAASSLSELVVDVLNDIDKQAIDGQIATALLTGIVAETARFSNEKTSADTMSISAELMAAGANQQLVATKLEEPKPAPQPEPAPEQPAPQPEQQSDNPEDKQEQPAEEQSADGTLEISHGDKSEDDKPVASLEDLAAGDDEPKEPEISKIHIDDQGSLRSIAEMDAEKKAEAAKGDGTVDPNQHLGGSRMILQPPTMGGAMGSADAHSDSYSDPLSLPQPSDPHQDQESQASGAPGSFASAPASANIAPPPAPFMPPSMTPGGQMSDKPSAPPLPPAHNGPVVPAPSPSTAGPQPFAFPGDGPKPVQPADSVNHDSVLPPSDLSPSAPADSSVDHGTPQHMESVRDTVAQAFATQPHDPSRPEPIQALNAQPLGDPLHMTPPPSSAPPDLNVPVPAETPQPAGATATQPAGSPPPVPPPMLPGQ